MPENVTAECWTGAVTMNSDEPTPWSTPLSFLLERTPEIAVRSVVRSGVDPLVESIEFDSRQVAAGSLFCCLRGGHRDGHEFAGAAVQSGAVALLTDHELDLPVAQVVVDDTRPAMAHLAAAYFDRPSRDLMVIGVTGTNGKTTITHILECALAALGHRVGSIGTLSGVHTTPEAPELQRRLATFRREGFDAVAMEVSSHALALDRVLGTRFRVGIFTNLGRDHLDLHETQERYFAAKARLFDPALTEHGVVNVDDVHGRLILDASNIPCTPFSGADALDQAVGPFEHEYTWRGVRIRVGLGGRFNVLNTLAAATTLAVVGYSPPEIAKALAATTPVRGRFEPVDAGQPFAVIVDYAHTPDALVAVLEAARGIAAQHQVRLVFGCGGDRDHEKRPQMGSIAVEHADQVVVTSDNPRSEDPMAIIDDVIDGVPSDYRGRITVEPDRHQAIALALAAAAPGDVVIIAGKGHETTQTFRSTVAPFDDRAVAQELLETMK